MKNYKITIKNILDNNQEEFKKYNIYSEDVKKALSKVFKNNKQELKKKSLKFNCILITEFIEVIK